VIRAFIAVEIAPQTAARIAAASEQLAASVGNLRWVKPANFHLTLKFLADIDASRITPIGAAITEALAPFPRFTINAKGLGVFPNPRRPRVLWVGLAGSQLYPLKSHVDSALMPLGFAPEDQSFTPHLTIGRWRQGERADRSLEQALGAWRDHEFGPSPIDEIILFQSELKPSGAIYHRLKVIALKPDPTREGGSNGFKP
jgi:2'-5' RNA ligase